MDSITQSVLGASIGEAMLGEKANNKGAIAGALIATIPDLDVVLYFFYSKIEMLSIHRGLSHSFVFNLLLSLLISFFLFKSKWLGKISYNRLFLFTGLCLFTHILLDTFTAYGTQLLLPFSDRRLGFDSINVVDPIYTMPLIIGLSLSLWFFKNKPSRRKSTNWGLIISTCYLLLTLCHKQYVQHSLSTSFNSSNIEFSELLTVPVGMANMNWYGVAKGNDSIYLKKYSLLSKHTKGIESFPINEKVLVEIDPILADKMRWFAKGFYTVVKDGKRILIFNLQVDMRGVAKLNGQKVPTLGYFEFKQKNNGTYEYSSGSIES